MCCCRLASDDGGVGKEDKELPDEEEVAQQLEDDCCCCSPRRKMSALCKPSKLDLLLFTLETSLLQDKAYHEDSTRKTVIRSRLTL